MVAWLAGLTWATVWLIGLTLEWLLPGEVAAELLNLVPARLYFWIFDLSGLIWRHEDAVGSPSQQPHKFGLAQ
jgi:hypothetical protein